MPKPRKSIRMQAELIRVHDGRDGEVDGDDPSAPRIRLQDWQVVEKVSVGSTDYVLLRRTRGPKSGVESLTPRERDAVRRACTGASNKDIAWAMGISDSTVGVLLLRACRKLNVVGRNALIEAFEGRRPVEVACPPTMLEQGELTDQELDAAAGGAPKEEALSGSVGYIAGKSVSE